VFHLYPNKEKLIKANAEIKSQTNLGKVPYRGFKMFNGIHTKLILSINLLNLAA
jgi:hypothetical protein